MNLNTSLNSIAMPSWFLRIISYAQQQYAPDWDSSNFVAALDSALFKHPPECCNMVYRSIFLSQLSNPVQLFWCLINSAELEADSARSYWLIADLRTDEYTAWCIQLARHKSQLVRTWLDLLATSLPDTLAPGFLAELGGLIPHFPVELQSSSDSLSAKQTELIGLNIAILNVTELRQIVLAVLLRTAVVDLLEKPLDEGVANLFDRICQTKLQIVVSNSLNFERFVRRQNSELACCFENALRTLSNASRENPVDAAYHARFGT